MRENNKTMLTILGPTATGKTRLAALVADKIDGEIISADSRQVYRGMDIGSGKDYEDYKVGDKLIPFHLIDIAEAGTEYNVFNFKKDCLAVYKDIISRKKFPILCGGSGMYIESIIDDYNLVNVPIDNELRAKLNDLEVTELIELLSTLRELHNTTDSKEQDRIIRAIEIEYYKLKNPPTINEFHDVEQIITGIYFDRDVIKARIASRLDNRLKNGMIEEIKTLLDNGLTPEQLKFYGLEYRYVTMYLTGEQSYDEMFGRLNAAICKFAKHQMTWYRRMEKKGFQIHWIDGNLDDTDKVNLILELLR